MHPHLNSQQLILLFGGAVAVISALLLGVYLLQRSFGLSKLPTESKAAKVNLNDEAAFTMATVKGVLTQLKTDQTAMQEKLIAAERRADENTRKFELLAREIDYGVVIFDAEGFITFSNPLVRKLLAVDTWSRRRFTEIFRDLPELLELVSECVESGTETRKKPVDFQGSDGNRRRLEFSVLQNRDRSGALESVACVFREAAPLATSAN